MKVFNFFHFIQNTVGGMKVMNNLVLEYCKFDSLVTRKGSK